MRSSSTDTISTSPSSVSSTDAKKINQLITLIKGTAESAKTAAGKDIVLVIGPTGAGKSTLINCFINKELVAAKDACGDYEFAAQDSKGGATGPKIGHERSCTTYPEVFLAKNGLAFCDTPGFFDTRSVVHSQSAYYGLHVVASVAKSIKGILFVCDIDTMRALRGKFFADAVELLTTMLHTNEEYGRSVFFLITKTENVTHEAVMATIAKKRKELADDGKILAAELLDLLANRSDSVMIVSPKNIMNEAGVDFAAKMHNRLRDAQIEQKHFSVGGGQTGKEKYLQAYQHVMNQAFNQIQVLTWKAEDLTAAENDIKTIEQNILSNNSLIVTTEEKLQAAKKDLTDKKEEHRRELKTLNDQLSAIPADIRRLQDAELKEIDGEETRRHIGFLEEIKRQHETNRAIAELGVEENINNREAQITDWQERINQARVQVEAKNQNIHDIEEEIRQLRVDNGNANQAIDEELRRLQAETNQLILSLQRDADYQNFPAIREVKLEIDRHRNLIRELDREIETLESERQRHQNRISALKNDNSDYHIHTSAPWNEKAVYGEVPKGVIHHYDYNYNASSDVKRDDYYAVMAVDGGIHGQVTDRFLTGRTCGGKYHTPSHFYGDFSHIVYISRKNSPESTSEVARLQTLCDGIVVRQTEKRNRKDDLRQEIGRLEIELRDRRNEEEQRIRDAAEARRVMIENRRAETRRLFEAALQECNQRIATLRIEITALESDITNWESNITANRTSIIEFRQGGRLDITRIDEERDNRIRVEEKRRDEAITQRQHAARERRQHEEKERVGAANQAIKSQIENSRQIQEVAEKLITDLDTELTRKRQAALNYDTTLQQSKERRTSLINDIGITYREFIGMKPTYDGVIELFALLKLENNYSEFISDYLGFLNTLFVTVHRLMSPISPSVDNAGPEQKMAADAKYSRQEMPSTVRGPHSMFGSPSPLQARVQPASSQTLGAASSLPARVQPASSQTLRAAPSTRSSRPS